MQKNAKINYEEAVAVLIHWAEHVTRSTRAAGCAQSNREAADVARSVPQLAVLHPWATSVLESEHFATDVDLNREAAATVLNPSIVPDTDPEGDIRVAA